MPYSASENGQHGRNALPAVSDTGHTGKGVFGQLAMRILNVRRIHTYLATNILPRALKHLGYHLEGPRGRSLPPERDFSLVVPFEAFPKIKREQPSVAIVCHLFHAELSCWLRDALENSGFSGDLFISTDTQSKADAIGKVLSEWSTGAVTIRQFENRGRDIAPKLLAFPEIFQRYELVLFVHSKKSMHYSFGDAWRTYLIRCLLGSPVILESILEIFRRRPDVGMVIPQHYGPLTEITPIDWGTISGRRMDWRAACQLTSIPIKFSTCRLGPCSGHGRMPCAHCLISI